MRIFAQLGQCIHFLGLRDSNKGPLFCHVDSMPLTKYQFGSVTSRALGALGLHGGRFGMHLFRIGVVSTTAVLSYTANQIRDIGRWWSTAHKRYVKKVTV